QQKRNVPSMDRGCQEAERLAGSSCVPEILPAGLATTGHPAWVRQKCLRPRERRRRFDCSRRREFCRRRRGAPASGATPARAAARPTAGRGDSLLCEGSSTSYLHLRSRACLLLYSSYVGRRFAPCPSLDDELGVEEMLDAG